MAAVHRALGRAVVAVGALLAAAAAPAQTVFLINAADTKDAKIGPGCQNDVESVALLFYIMLPEGRLKETRLIEDQATADKLLAAVDRCRAGADDTLVFYWSGHGGFDAQKKEHFLVMPGGALLYRSTLLGAMKKKPARLAVLLTDCCANVVDTTAGLTPLAPASPDPRRKIAPLFDELLIRSRGLVDINAASEGEVAIGTQLGGLMTLALTSAALPGKLDPNDERPIEKQMFGYCWQNYDRRVSWRTLVAELRPAVQELFQKVEPQGVRLPSGGVAAKQTVVAWSLPAEPAADRRGSRFGVVAVEHGGDGVRVVEVPADSPGARLTVVATGAVLRLEPGDVIVEINGRAIRSGAEYVEAVKGSPQTMELVVRDVKDGSRLKLRTRLRY